MSKKLRIVMVDDCAADVELVELELRRSGLLSSLQRVETAEHLMRALKESPPDVVLSDCALPGFSGREALALARREQPETPFIAVSGSADEETSAEFIKLGATDFISKQ